VALIAPWYFATATNTCDRIGDWSERVFVLATLDAV
jgi:hypothetical protein